MCMLLLAATINAHQQLINERQASAVEKNTLYFTVKTV